MASVSERASREARLARLRAVEMDAALKEEGFEEEGSHAVFVRWQRQTIEELGELLVGAEESLGRRVDAVCARLDESSRSFREDEFRRAEILMAGGERAIAIAKQAAETAIAAAHRGEKEFNRSVAQIAEELSTRLLDSSQKWLVLKQRGRNRRDAWLLALCVTVVAVGVLIAGYELRGYQDDPAVTAYYETQERIAECRREPVQVKDMRIGALRPACWLDQVLARRGGG